jgi:hypothetical protein
MGRFATTPAKGCPTSDRHEVRMEGSGVIAAQVEVMEAVGWNQRATPARCAAAEPRGSVPKSRESYEVTQSDRSQIVREISDLKK